MKRLLLEMNGHSSDEGRLEAQLHENHADADVQQDFCLLVSLQRVGVCVCAPWSYCQMCRASGQPPPHRQLHCSIGAKSCLWTSDDLGGRFGSFLFFSARGRGRGVRGAGRGGGPFMEIPGGGGGLPGVRVGGEGPGGCLRGIGGGG